MILLAAPVPEGEKLYMGVCNICANKAYTPKTIWPSTTTRHPRRMLVPHQYRFHRKAANCGWIWYDHIYRCLDNKSPQVSNHRKGIGSWEFCRNLHWVISMTIWFARCHCFWQRCVIYRRLLATADGCYGYKAIDVYSISPPDIWPSRESKLDFETVPPCIYVRMWQLSHYGRPPPKGRVRVYGYVMWPRLMIGRLYKPLLVRIQCVLLYSIQFYEIICISFVIVSYCLLCYYWSCIESCYELCIESCYESREESC